MQGNTAKVYNLDNRGKLPDLLKLTTMVPSITSVSTIADPKQLRFELSGSNIELSPKPATCSTANLVG
jgi:hypothetical protein